VSKQKVVRLLELLKREPRALKLMVDTGETVVARNRTTGKLRTIPVRALYQNNPRFYNAAGGTYDYLVPEEKVRAILAKLRGRSKATPSVGPDSERSAGEEGHQLLHEESREQKGAGITSSMPPNFGEEYRRIAELPKEERVSLLEKAKQELQQLSEKKGATAEEVNEALVRTTTDAALVNRATVQEALRMSNEEAKAYTEELVNATEEMIRSTALLVDHDLYDEELINELVERSDGTVVQHMTRVFLNGFAFMLYYNREFLTSSLANRIRINFNKRYKRHYRKLLPHLHEDHLSLEHVFYGGIKALSEVEINRFATGFLVHDVGKAEDIEYHEGEAGFDRETVVRHVKLGYKAVMNKTTYPREAALITGYHHEYYGDPSGYGYFREFLQAYKNMKPEAKIDYLMSYEMEPLLDYQVLAYFPAKMLEVVDVFDSLTDPNRKYRKPLTPPEAMELLESQFVQEKLKVDPIILDLFRAFLTGRGILEE
jgi:HD-GYP domain-containing protein (c-di-GMP phosphodiesterase class II)